MKYVYRKNVSATQHREKIEIDFSILKDIILIYVNYTPYKRKRERKRDIILYINYILVNLFRANDAILILYKSNKENIEIAEIKIKKIRKKFF